MAEAPLWTLAPETDGVTCDVSDEIARALCRRPELRSLTPHDLAEELGVDPARAQLGILRLASRTSGVRVALRGVSFDEAISAGGRAMGRFPIAYAEAGSLDGNGGHSPWPAIAAFAFVMVGLYVGLEVLGKTIAELPKGEEP